MLISDYSFSNNFSLFQLLQTMLVSIQKIIFGKRYIEITYLFSNGSINYLDNGMKNNSYGTILHVQLRNVGK